MSIVPIRGKFDDWRALLAHVMEDEEAAGVILVTFTEDGRLKAAHSEGCLQGHMALAGAYWLKVAAEPLT